MKTRRGQSGRRQSSWFLVAEDRQYNCRPNRKPGGQWTAYRFWTRNQVLSATPNIGL